MPKEHDTEPAKDRNLGRDTEARHLAGEAFEVIISFRSTLQQVVIEDYKNYLEELGRRNSIKSDLEYKNSLKRAYTSKTEFEKLTGSERRKAIFFLAYLTFIEGTGTHTQRHLEQAFKEEKKKAMRETFAKEYYPFFRLLTDQQE